MKLSVTLFLSDILPHRRKLFHKIVKNKIFKNRTTEEVFTHLKKSGLAGFELMLPQYAKTTNEDILEVKKLVKLYSFPVLSVHQSLRIFTSTKVAEITRLFEIAAMVSAGVIVLHINSARKQIFDEEYIKALHQLEGKYGIKISFENMEKFFGSYFYGHRWHARKFSSLVRKLNFHITFDIVHLAHSGGDIMKFYKNNKERIVNVHISDYKRNPLNSNLRPMRYKHMQIGKGELPIREFLRLLKKDKYIGLITMEIHSDLKGIDASIAIINQFQKS